MPRFVIKDIPEDKYKTYVRCFNMDTGAGDGDKDVLKPEGKIAFDPAALSIAVDLSYADLMDRFPMLKKQLVSDAPVKVENPKECFVQSYVTEEGKKFEADYLDGARDHYRDFDFEDAPDPGIDANQTQGQQAAALLANANNPGLLLGGGHGDKDTHDCLIKNMEAGVIDPKSGTGLLFIEELKAIFQPAVDEYLDGPLDAPLPAPLKSLFEKMASSMPRQNFAGILEAAKKKGVRVYGIDSGDANPDCKNTSAKHAEPRCAMMNMEAEKIIKAAQKKHPGQKFVAMVGSAHSNTHAGGVPGLAQVFKAPAVVIDQGSGKLQWDPEDKANREMPSKLEQKFIDRYFEEIEKAAEKALGEDGAKLHADVMVNKGEMRAKATALLKPLRQTGALKGPGDVEKILAQPVFRQRIEGEAGKMATRRQRRNDLKDIIDGGAAFEVGALLPEFLREDPDFLKTEAEAGGDTLLHYAAKAGKEDHIASLLASGADVNERVKGATPLHLAKSPEAAARLVAAGADPNAPDKDGATPLLRALKEGRADVAADLVGRGADLNRPDYDGATPLHAAIANGQTDVAKRLLAGGADVTVRNAKGQTALQAAALAGRADLIPDLIARGVPVDQYDNEGNSPLALALGAGQVDAARALLGQGADPDHANVKGERPVHVAAEKVGLDFVKELAGAGADLKAGDRPDATGRSGLEAALIGEFKRQARATAEGPQQAVKKAEEDLTAADNKLKQAQARLQDLKRQQDEANEQVSDKARKGEGYDSFVQESLKLWGESQEALKAVNEAAGAKTNAEDALRVAKQNSPKTAKLATAEDDVRQAKDAQTLAEKAQKDAETLLEEKKNKVKEFDEKRAKNRNLVNDLVYNRAVQERDDAAADLDPKKKDAKAARDAVYPLEAQVRALQRPFALDEGEIDFLADSLAQDALRAGTLTSPDDVAGLVQDPKATQMIADVVDRSMVRAAHKRGLLDALKAKDVAKAREILGKDDFLLNADLDPDGEPGSLPLHVAAKEGNLDLFDQLINMGADGTVLNPGGKNALHVVCDQRVEVDNKAKQTDQLAMARKLVALGVDVNAQDKKGQTPLHCASRNPNAGVVAHLLEHGADENLQDERGWRPADVAVATTKPQTEKAFVEHSKDPNVRKKLIDDGETGLDTLTVLMRATKCENPKDVAKVEETYRELYANPLFRPIMDLAALDACLERQAPALDGDNANKGGGMRIFIADNPQVGHLYNAVQLHKAPQGAFDENADVLMIGAREGKESHYFPGTLIHEMTHAAARMLYGQDVIPCPPGPNGQLDDQGKLRPELKTDPYVLAIEKDMRQIALCQPSNPAEERVRDTIGGRMNDPAYVNRGDLAFLQEFLVGVPQMIAEVGYDNVKALAPGLTDYFETTLVEKCKDARANDPRFAAVYRNQFDNTELDRQSDARGPRKPPGVEPWVKNGTEGTKAADIAAKVALFYTTQHGDMTVPPENTRGNASLPYDPKCFVLKPDEKRVLDKRMKEVAKILEKEMAQGGVPAEMPTEALRGLIKDVATAARAGGGKGLARAVKARVNNFKREAAKAHLEREVAAGKALTNEQVAEIVLLRAEDAAWKAAHPGDDSLPRPDFDPKEHKALARTMKRKIADTIPDKKWSEELVGNPAALDKFVQAQAQALVGARKAVYTKSANPDKVKLDKKRAEQVWFNKLRELAPG